jgi:hypothetical protein
MFEMIPIVIAGAAGAAAVIIAVVQRSKKRRQASSPSEAAFAPMAASLKPSAPVSSKGDRSLVLVSPKVPISKRRRKDKKGRVAPEGYYFDDDGILYDLTGNVFTDFMIIDQLCNVSCAESVESVIEEKPVNAEPSQPEPASEVTPSTSFSDLQIESPKHSAPVAEPSYSAPESSYSDSGGGDSGGYDSGGDSGGGFD